jgi:hypothetical protein
MSIQTQTWTISTTAHFAVTDAAGQESSVYRELTLVEKDEGGWLVVVTEPDPIQPEGDVQAGDMISRLDEAAGCLTICSRGSSLPPHLGSERARIALVPR